MAIFKLYMQSRGIGRNVTDFFCLIARYKYPY